MMYIVIVVPIYKVLLTSYKVAEEKALCALDCGERSERTQRVAGEAEHTIYIIVARHAKRPSVSRIHRISSKLIEILTVIIVRTLSIHCPCIKQYRFNDPFQAIRDSDDLVHRD
jgi:hypothetical protein